MKIIFLIVLSSVSLAHAQITTADRSSYIILLQPNLSLNQLNECFDSICRFSGNKANVECEIVSDKFRIIAAILSNSALKKVKAFSCIKSLRLEHTDIEAKPRSGRSN